MRERRNAEKLEKYYQEFQKSGKVNPNVHPWVAESWSRSKKQGVSTERKNIQWTLKTAELKIRQEKHSAMMEFLDEIVKALQPFIYSQELSLLLTDEDGYILKEYNGGHLGPAIGFVSGQRILEEDIGTTSLSIAYMHQHSFILFGAEAWQDWLRSGWLASVPVRQEESIRYGLTLVSSNLDSDFEMGEMILELIRTSLEEFIRNQEENHIQRTILDAVPFALYRVLPDSKIAYANALGHERLSTISPDKKNPKLTDVVLNYDRTPIAKAFGGVPTYNKEITWHTPRKSYEDITTAVPVERNGEVSEVITVTMPIEDLRTLVAYAAGFTAKYSLDSLYGQTPIFKAMKEKAEKVAKQRTPVLLLGDSGTGKQRLAHGIHQASDRANGPFVAVKFGDAPLELLEADLFGWVNEDGEGRSGKFELADGGTIFLNTLEKLPQALAHKLAQVLSQGKFCRIGETVPRTTDIRVIGASDVELKRWVDRGEFSGDLYQWLSRSVVRVPSLSSRREDIPLLARHIIDELAQQNGLPTKSLSDGAVEVLLSYDWPRNIKQLQQVVEQAFFRTSNLTLEASDILLPGADQASQAWKEDRETFLNLWNAAGGNVSRLSNMLRVSRVTLYRYMKRYGIIKE